MVRFVCEEAVDDMEDDSVDEVEDEFRAEGTHVSDWRRPFKFGSVLVFRVCCGGCCWLVLVVDDGFDCNKLTGRSRTRSGRLLRPFGPLVVDGEPIITAGELVELLLLKLVLEPLCKSLPSFLPITALRLLFSCFDLSSSSELLLKFSSVKSLILLLVSWWLAFSPLPLLDEVDEVEELELDEGACEEDNDETIFDMVLFVALAGLLPGAPVLTLIGFDLVLCCCVELLLIAPFAWTGELVLKSSCFMSSRTDARASSMWCIFNCCLLLIKLSKLISCW